MRITRWIAAALVCGVVGLAAGAVRAGEVPYWPSEQDQRLKELDAQVLDAQRQRFRALFGNDPEAAKKLDKRFKELQKERRELLQATGRMPRSQ